MAVKTILSFNQAASLCAAFPDAGKLLELIPLQEGTVQTNYKAITTKGAFILRLYENRSPDSVRFEQEVLQRLTTHQFPCAPFLPTASGDLLIWENKPVMLFQFMEGESIEHPSQTQKQALFRLMGEMHRITQNWKPSHSFARLNYDVPHLLETAVSIAAKEGTENGKQKLIWLQEQAALLEFPSFLTKGVCHCDYYFSNLLYQGDTTSALLDFDDANYTYLPFDILSVTHFFLPDFDHDTWQSFSPRDEILDFKQAKENLDIYQKIYPIPEKERPYLFDILKLGILFDCLWYFSRGHVSDFFEKRKIDALNQLGREAFTNSLFH